MKKSKLLLLVSLIALPLSMACSKSVYKPSRSYPGDPLQEGIPNMTVNFYLDYSHSEEPLYTMRWYMLKPLGEVPEKAKLTDANAADPLYSKFLGYSEYSSSIGENLWDFENDFKQSNILNLYGIWVSENVEEVVE